jgi:hypothetical protein
MKKKTCGIYLITEKASRKDVYVGQSIGIEGRWSRHWKKFPQERFDYRILLECPPCDLDFWEQHYIRVLKTHWSEGGENQDWGGQYWPRPEEPLSPATRAKLSAALKGRVRGPLSEEQKAKLSAALKGKVRGPLSEETKAKLRGRVQSEEEKAKQSAAQKGRVSPNKGVPMSEETKAKISAAQKGRAQKRRVSPPKRNPLSEETKAKLSTAAKARLALKRAAKAAATAALEAFLTIDINFSLNEEAL